jgi:hypothetical protein
MLNIAVWNRQIQQLILIQKCSLRLCTATEWLLYVSPALVAILSTGYIRVSIGQSVEKSDCLREGSDNLETTILSRNYDRSKTAGECGIFHLSG